MRQRLHDYLQVRPGGATPEELLALVFAGRVREPEFAARFLRTMLADDPRFRWADGRWRACVHDLLGRPLAETRFVVVDLETTGLQPGGETITEIGAVRVEGGRLTDSFQALVNPGRPIPPFIVQLTGITDAMVADAPRIDTVFPRFLEFVGQTPLVAHNAKFDMGHLGSVHEWLVGRPLELPVLCTLRLAKRLLPHARRRGLAAVAEALGIACTDHHRALPDARVAAEILCVFLEEVQRLGIGRLDQLLDFQRNASDGRPFVMHVSRRRLDEVPDVPGVYHLLGEDGRVLYVGRARRLRARMASYFTNARGHSPKTLELIRHVRDFCITPTGSELAAALLEARQIREIKPPYNRQRRHLPRVGFLKLGARGAFARLWVTQRLAADRATYVGPFLGRQAADDAHAVLTRVFGIRSCAPRLVPSPDVAPCLLGQVGTCPAPCAARIDAAGYRANVGALLAFLDGHDETALARLALRRDALVAEERFEMAARVQRDHDLLETIRRGHRALAWVVGRQNFVVLLPTVERDAAQLYAVLGGRLAFEARVVAVTDLLAAIAFVRERFARYQDAPLAREDVEGATILAAWMRDRRQEGLLLPLASADDLAARLDELVVTVDELRQCGPLPAIDGLS